jgi:transcriptional regulator with XRE-family HTH domain
MPNPLKAYLALNDITATEFAKKINVSPSFLSRLMTGEREADTSTLDRIERETGGKVRPDLWIGWWRKSAKERA